MTAREVDLFGAPVNRYETLKSRLGVWPTTVWRHDHQARAHRELVALIGDSGEARDECFTKTTDDRSVYRGKVTASVFSPSLAAWILNLWAPREGLCFDPFAGGGTRAIMAAKHGLRYAGTELRAEEVSATLARCESAGVGDSVELMEADARCASSLLGRHSADFCLTCPPYYNLEVYSDDGRDLSNAPTYTDFLRGMSSVISETGKILRVGALSAWVVGLIRSPDGALLSLHHDITRLHSIHGFSSLEEVVVSQENNGAIQRVGQFEKGHRHLVRTHEYVLLFRNDGLAKTEAA
jgi:hypothetical protein